MIRGGSLCSSTANPSHLPLLYRWEGKGDWCSCCSAKTCFTDHTNNKLQVSREWRVQSDFIDIHAVRAYRALLPSNP